MAQNCWEAKNCGRQAGGAKTAEFGICPATTNAKLTGSNNGRNGGRSCWIIAGTLCGGKVQGDFAQKEKNCLSCDFYKKVKEEEGVNFISLLKLKERLK